MNKVTKTSGIAWGYGAISTATWEGVLLRDVLMYSGLLTPGRAHDINVQHVQFEGAEGLQVECSIHYALYPYTMHYTHTLCVQTAGRLQHALCTIPIHLGLYS
jgi:hypothetical protein